MKNAQKHPSCKLERLAKYFIRDNVEIIRNTRIDKKTKNYLHLIGNGFNMRAVHKKSSTNQLKNIFRLISKKRK